MNEQGGVGDDGDNIYCRSIEVRARSRGISIGMGRGDTSGHISNAKQERTFDDEYVTQGLEV